MKIVRFAGVCSEYAVALFLATFVFVALSTTQLTAADAPDQPKSPPPPPQDITESDPAAAAAREAELVAGVRQLTFEGRRAGEGYFSADGSRLVFQSEREPRNPFFQIYLMDLETGDTDRISPGHGKTTCSWIHPHRDAVLFASTHDDPLAVEKQQEELRQRASGQQRRYSWDYDEHFEIYVLDRESGELTNITDRRGYDAEGSFSPDGRLVAFASNRRAYTDELSADERALFEHDPATMNDIYLCRADGTGVKRLTTEPGYDGGPFFSPDGRRICWRHFTTNGAIAEVMTMNIDGSDKRQLTRLGAMSWAPFYHPSGEYLIFTTNLHGFANFELYLIDVAGRSRPVRVTYTPGFDGLPVFSPDGNQLAWTSNRTGNGQSQIFLAKWNHERARALLGIGRRTADADRGQQEAITRAATRAAEVAGTTAAAIAPPDLQKHVEFLCDPQLAGRLTGTLGERLATAYVARYFEELGLTPAGDDGGWFDDFEFTAGARLGPDNRLTWGDHQYAVDKQWRPVAFSRNGNVPAAPVVFAGYGISAPEADGQEAYDSFVHLDVTDKWVLVFRYMPEDIPAERRQQLARYAGLRYKAMTARDQGARGLIVVSGPSSQVKNQLIPLQQQGSLFGSSLPVISVTDELAAQWLTAAGKDIAELQTQLDGGQPQLGFDLKGVELAARIDVEHVKRTGRNVLGLLPAGSKPVAEMIVVGAHVDHLGTGGDDSLARDDERGKIHFGADDNASGVAALLEIAEYLADMQHRGKLPLKRDILFAAWSGEELGTLGSSHFVQARAQSAQPPDNPPPASDEDGQKQLGDGQSERDEAQSKRSLYPAVAACLNMDMVGRLRDQLILQGAGSSSVWRGEVERRNAPIGLPIKLQDDCYLPTDAGAFYLAGVPILSAFTGPHADYHTPRDTPDKLNYEGAARTARLVGLIARGLAMRDEAPDYLVQEAPKKGGQRAHLRAYLGTIPDYANSDKNGVALSGVARGGPADRAGLKAGDLIVELAGRKLDNIYDYTYAIEALKIGQPVKVVVQRDGKRVELQITPGSRE